MRRRWIDPETRAMMDARAKRELDREHERQVREHPMIEDHPDDVFGIDNPSRLTLEDLIRAIVKREIDEERGLRTPIVRELPELRSELSRRRSASGILDFDRMLGAERARQEGCDPL